jgi:hypothetical protein
LAPVCRGKRSQQGGLAQGARAVRAAREGGAELREDLLRAGVGGRSTSSPPPGILRVRGGAGLILSLKRRDGMSTHLEHAWDEGLSFGLRELCLARPAEVRCPRRRGKVRPESLARAYTRGLLRACALGRASGSAIDWERLLRLEREAKQAGEGYAALRALERPEILDPPLCYGWLVGTGLASYRIYPSRAEAEAAVQRGQRPKRVLVYKHLFESRAFLEYKPG